MKRSSKRMLFLSTLLMPIIGLLYLYTRNAQYLDFAQVLITAAILVVVSAIGYGVFRLILRSSVSAMVSCLILWIAFFAFSPLYPGVLQGLIGSYFLLLAAYFGAALVLALIVGLLTRKVHSPAVGTIALVMSAMLLVLNLYPAVVAAVESYQLDDSTEYKKDYVVDANLPSPNVYWIHTDGMLGFDAFETYFGDDQREFKAALAERGFQINEEAQLEVGHRTVVAIAALMSPYFYDSNLSDRFSSHEAAMDSAWDRGFLRNELQNARTFNETRIAFEEKGYTSQTLADFKIYFPPVSNRFYVTLGGGHAYLLDLGESAETTFLSYAQAGELTEMLVRKNATPTLLKLTTRLIDWNLTDMRREELTHKLSSDEALRMLQNSTDAARFAPTLEALYDALYTPAPTFNLIFYDSAHAPFVADENGIRTGLDSDDLFNYPPQHRYSAKVLIEMLDMILSQDPDAVIVVQADHGLHLQSREQIEAALGEEAVIPLWNQVLSAIRVPEAYQNGEEENALSNPLNMARYLVNGFVGENYEYLK